MAQMRTKYPDEAQLMLLAFDLLHQDGVDLRGLPLSGRKRDLNRLCRKSRVPFLKHVQTFPDGAVLLEHCNNFGFEGVVSKRLSSRYVSGPSRHWTKSKCLKARRNPATAQRGSRRHGNCEEARGRACECVSGPDMMTRNVDVSLQWPCSGRIQCAKGCE